MTWKNAKQAVRQSALDSLLQKSTKKMSVLEFGAFASPMFDPSQKNVFFADRLNTEELKTSVKDPAKRKMIVDVDYVVPPDFSIDLGRKFDLIVANHVVEHIPDVLSWLDNIGRALTNNGCLFLAVPDKRFTFDIVRDTTLARELIDNFEVRRTQPSISSIVDARYNRRNINFGSDVWSGRAAQKLDSPSDVDARALSETLKKQMDAGEYIDAHCNVFTEESFFRVFRQLEEMKYGDMRLQATFPVQKPYNEFYAVFTKTNKKFGAGLFS